MGEGVGELMVRFDGGFTMKFASVVISRIIIL